MPRNLPPLIQALPGPVCIQTVEDVADVVVSAITTAFPGRTLDARAIASGLIFTALDVLAASGIDAPQCRLINMIADAEFDPQEGRPPPSGLN